MVLSISTKASSTYFDIRQCPIGLALPNICDNKQNTGDCHKFLAAYFTNIWRELAYRHKYLAKLYLPLTSTILDNAARSIQDGIMRADVLF